MICHCKIQLLSIPHRQYVDLSSGLVLMDRNYKGK